MKKILALLLAAVFAATLLTACGNKAKPKTEKNELATEAVTEKVTEAPVEEATEEATEAPVLPTAAPNEFVYTDPAGKYQVTVPIIWNDTGLILSETDVDGVEFVRFYYKAAYDEGAGHVFHHRLVKDSSKIVDVTQMPHAEEYLQRRLSSGVCRSILPTSSSPPTASPAPKSSINSRQSTAYSARQRKVSSIPLPCSMPDITEKQNGCVSGRFFQQKITPPTDPSAGCSVTGCRF